MFLHYIILNIKRPVAKSEIHLSWSQCIGQSAEATVNNISGLHQTKDHEQIADHCSPSSPFFFSFSFPFSSSLIFCPSSLLFLPPSYTVLLHFVLLLSSSISSFPSYFSFSLKLLLSSSPLPPPPPPPSPFFLAVSQPL